MQTEVAWEGNREYGLEMERTWLQLPWFPLPVQRTMHVKINGQQIFPLWIEHGQA